MVFRHPLVRLLIVTFIAVNFGFAAVRIVHMLGTQAAPPTVGHHPWSQRSIWLVARAEPAACNPSGIKDLANLEPAWLIWLDIQLDAQGIPHVVCPLDRIFDLDLVPLGPPLKDVLPALLERGLIFNLRALDASVGDAFFKEVGPLIDAKVDIGIASTSQALLRDLRKKRPQWLFAADASTWTKLLASTSLGMGSAVELWPDFFVASPLPEKPNSFSLATSGEIHRRGKIEILEWDGKSEIPRAWKQSVRGVLTNRPKIFPADAFFAKMGAR